MTDLVLGLDVGTTAVKAAVFDADGHEVATGKAPAAIAPFRIDRFRDDRAIPDRSSAGTH